MDEDGHSETWRADGDCSEQVKDRLLFLLFPVRTDSSDGVKVQTVYLVCGPDASKVCRPCKM